MQKFNSEGATFTYTQTGEDKHNAQLVLWAHGWGQNHSCFLPLIQSLAPYGTHIALDLPGFGQAPQPPEHWGTREYADAIAAWLKEESMAPVIWVGHSFGCRIGVQLAAHHPECIKKMVLISGAGLKRKRPHLKRLFLFLRIKLFKLLKRLVPDGSFKNKIIHAFGSPDYKNSSALRHVFVRVVNEDLSESARGIKCPVTLIYGSEDTETPPEIGERYARLIQNAKLHIMDGQDHYTVLQNGRHPVIKILSNVMKDK